MSNADKCFICRNPNVYTYPAIGNIPLCATCYVSNTNEKLKRYKEHFELAVRKPTNKAIRALLICDKFEQIQYNIQAYGKSSRLAQKQLEKQILITLKEIERNLAKIFNLANPSKVKNWVE